MKRSKLLIPTFATLAVAPTIALTACNQPSVEQEIIDAIFKPYKLQPKVVADFKTEFEKLTDSEKKQELIYDAFISFNHDKGTGSDVFNIRKLYQDKNEGAFKVNVNECNVVKKNNEYLASLRGYVCYVFEKQHIWSDGTINYTFNANDYIMLTFDFIDRPMQLITNINCHYVMIDPEDEGACLGFTKLKYESGKKEVLSPIFSIDTVDTQPTNSNYWTIA